MKSRLGAINETSRAIEVCENPEMRRAGILRRYWFRTSMRRCECYSQSMLPEDLENPTNHNTMIGYKMQHLVLCEFGYSVRIYMWYIGYCPMLVKMIQGHIKR
jgi:hypothetical protein